MLRVLQLVIIVGATLSLAMTFTDCPFHHLQHLENSISSGESGVGGVLTAIFSVIGAKQKSFIDISVGGAQYLNVIQNIFGFFPLLHKDTFMHNISTVDDIVQVFSTQSVPSVFDLLHVKYGMSTWWIMASLLKATEGYRPRVIVVEVNTMLGCRDEVSSVLLIYVRFVSLRNTDSVTLTLHCALIVTARQICLSSHQFVPAYLCSAF